MAVHLGILLILTGLRGIHSITTVSEVSVKAGNSITIPCLYESKYINNVKYLCKGYSWNSCSYAVKTNQQSSGKFLISDDKSQRIFNVTIKYVTDEDTDYWCAVEINGGADVREFFQLSVTRDTPWLYVHHQEIAGFKGEKTTISCFHHNSGQKKWCRLGSSCVTGSGLIAGTRVTITAGVNVFSVTMSGLMIESSGWYWCVSGDFQMPVHVTVTEKPTTTTRATTTQTTTNSTTISPTSKSVNVTTVTMSIRASIDLKILIIPLSLLIFIVLVTLFIWLLLKKHQQNKSASLTMTAAEEEVTYANVGQVRKPSSQTSYTESDVDVIYSSVVAIRQKSVRGVQAIDENVTYSTLA